ncbi:cardiolipin synthase ClsB [Pseudomonas sp. FW300-N1A1]|uniref:cardiolipin synthase ClsB n=1 Tax=Pseudomonas sp. FW300-N1A1 TaxID=2075555 RepID=UPI000CD184F5|nr:cardiolipin synthase ClsB [Pseudomonas sp. FW300-N1A1]POA18437.1 cardiolipin synthase ClsB [Pseudomonas sp. FW300-N1A1]
MSSAPLEKTGLRPTTEAPELASSDRALNDLDYGWHGSNRVELLENGEAYFPKVFEALRQASNEILLETFILFEDKVGNELQQILIEAAQRGVRVTVSLDGFGCGEVASEFLLAMCDAGVQLQLFDPAPRRLGIRTNWFRRLHRKIVVVDGTLAFIGGINFSADHLADFGPEAKQDYAVLIEGPAVVDIHHFVLVQNGRRARARYGWRRRKRQRMELALNGHGGQVRLVYRDNRDHPRDIEDAYLQALRSARQRVVIANAYFFPGYHLLREIRNAARRGVEVRLILQGQPDMRVAKLAARQTYDYLQKSGVVIYEYCDRPLHGKVALVDGDWSTVGSSNLDPLSLSLNLEANVLIRDQAFNRELFERLDQLSHEHCTVMPVNPSPRGLLWRMTIGFLVFHCLRHFPAWAGWLPAHKARLQPFTAPTQPAGEPHEPP